MFKFELGQKVKDTVTGFEGIVTGQHQWVTGCATYTVQPPVDKDGKVPDNRGVDEVSLELLPEERLELETKDDPGGPHDTPSRQMKP